MIVHELAHLLEHRAGDADLVERQRDRQSAYAATGIELAALGNIPFTVDDQPVHIPDAWTYKGMMLSDIPNLAWIFGYAFR